MKEATGELNITVITILAIVAISALFVTLILPVIRQSIMTHTCEASYGRGCVARRTTTGEGEEQITNEGEVLGEWQCDCTASENENYAHVYDLESGQIVGE